VLLSGDRLGHRPRPGSVEAGAQGEHKLAARLSAGRDAFAALDRDPNFREAVARYLSAERRAVGEEIEVLTAFGPFRKGEPRE